MKINGIEEIKNEKKEELIKSGGLNHINFKASLYNDEYKNIVFALKPKKTKEKIKEEFIKEITQYENLADGVIEEINNMNVDDLVSLKYFEVFDLSLNNVYKTTTTNNNVYKTVGYEVKTTMDSNGDISSNTTPIKQYSHSYTTSKNERLYHNYNSDFPSITMHSFLKKGTMYSFPKEVDISELLSKEEISELDIIRINQPNYKSFSVNAVYETSNDLLKYNHDSFIKNVIFHKLTNASHIEKVTINKIILHPIWEVKFKYNLNEKKEEFISFISDCDDSITSSEYLDLPIAKKEISKAHTYVSIAYTIIMGLSLIIGLISLYYSFNAFVFELSIPYILCFLSLLFLTIKTAIIGFRTELYNSLYYSYFKKNLPKMYTMIAIGVIVFILLFIFGIKILFMEK